MGHFFSQVWPPHFPPTWVQWIAQRQEFVFHIKSQPRISCETLSVSIPKPLLPFKPLSQSHISLWRPRTRPRSSSSVSGIRFQRPVTQRSVAWRGSILIHLRAANAVWKLQEHPAATSPEDWRRRAGGRGAQVSLLKIISWPLLFFCFSRFPHRISLDDAAGIPAKDCLLVCLAMDPHRFLFRIFPYFFLVI